jgi:hypothetical protein
VRHTAGWIGDESSLATANSCCNIGDNSVQSGAGERGPAEDLWAGGGEVARRFSGKNGPARKVAVLPDESSVSTLACRFGDWDVSLSVE